MEIYHFEQIVLDWPISVELKRYGLDWMVQITGRLRTSYRKRQRGDFCGWGGASSKDFAAVPPRRRNRRPIAET